MMPATDSFWDILSQDEADFVQAIMLELANQPWAKPIVAGINDNGGLTRENKDCLFELRFAYERVGGRVKAPTLPLRPRVRAPARETAAEIRDRGRPTRSSGGRSIG